MGKKRKQKDVEPAIQRSVGPGGEDLAQHSAFFDSLVELVPAKYYLEPEEPLLNLKFMKKNERLAAKRALKEQYRKNKRAKMDPDRAQSAIELQKARAAQSAQRDSAELQMAPPKEQEAHPPRLKLQSQAGTGEALADGPATLEELRKRLQSRLQNMRSERHADRRQQSAQQAKDWRQKAVGRRLQSHSDASRKAQQPEVAVASSISKPVQRRNAAARSTDQISFGRLQLAGNMEGTKRRNKKQSKAQLLEAARKQQSQPDALGAQEAWKKALARAEGKKVLDDPKLLNRAAKREQKQKQKKAKVWTDRLAKQASEQNVKQQRRKSNLQARADAKVQNKKDKREKRLMRPGFEGRRDTFIS